MTRCAVAVCALLALSELTPARAQLGFRGGHGFRGGFHMGGWSPWMPVSPGFGPSPFVPYGFVPVAPVNPFNPFGPPPVVVAPIIIGGNFGMPDPGVAAGNPSPNTAGSIVQAGAREFIVIEPKKTTIPEITRVEPAPLPLPVPKLDPFAPTVKVAAEVSEADPKKENARLVKLARAAFAGGDYGRAAEHFERAATADPADARTCFLHAQAKLAAGQYADAVARIRAGLTRDPKWPAAAFDPAELYAGRADRYAAHLAALRKAVADTPNQPTLEFLLGYQLWFGGEKAEAEKLFRAAEKRLAAPGPIALFK